ncbi:CSC1 protein, partial [Pomatorhinus ruficollis]|nr:CSC1 protein [Pomatorhinus ruficollis]
MDSTYSMEAAPDGAGLTSLDVLLFLDAPVNSTEEQCFSARSRSTVLEGLPFGGVPTVLAINFILWLLLLLVFSCLRKAAWDYGRLALLMDNDSLTSLFYGEQSEKEKSPSESSPLDADNKDVGFCSWLLSIYQMKDEEIQSKCGIDATTYLSFQRHLLVLLMLVCVLSVAVILPVNFSGDLLGNNPTHFGRTTIANIPTQDRLLWLHSIFALLYFIFTILCMAHHSVHLEYRENEKVRNHPSSNPALFSANGQLLALHKCWSQENLSVRGTSWWVRFILLNICLFVLLFFLTTPAIIVNTMDMFNVTHPVESLKNPIITQFFPTLLLWAFSVFLPFLVYYSAFFESHWTRSSENQMTMHKCFFFLVFMVIILPSLGLSSLDLFFRWLFDTHFLDEAEIKFQCVFLPDNGAFFVNYVVTSSLIGTAMELLRIPGLLVYTARLCFAKSEPERLHVKRSQAYQFQFGLEYAWTCCIFSVVMTYSITCPIIVPFGLLYMLLKHMVDRYNIYYVYIPTKLNQRLHVAAISQVVVAPILCMFWLLFFSVLRLGPTRPVTLFTFVVLLSCIIFSFFGLCLKKLQPRKPSSYQMSDQSEGTFNDVERSSVSSTPNSNLFVATVLQEPELSLTPAASPAHQSYGTMGNHLEPVEDGEDGGLQSFETELETVEGEYRSGPVIESQARYQ